MKPLPIILDQKDLPACQSFAVASYYNHLTDKNLNPEVLYWQTQDWYMKKYRPKMNDGAPDPHVEDVLDYMTELGYLTYQTQRVGRNNMKKWFYTESYYRSTNQVQVGNLQAICRNFDGCVITLNVPNGGDFNVTNGYMKKEWMEGKGREHAVWCYDYTDSYFILINSWGTNYGDGTGTIKLPFEYTHLILNSYQIFPKKYEQLHN